MPAAGERETSSTPCNVYSLKRGKRVMTVKIQEILEILQRHIHSAVFATMGRDGMPQTRAIDIMLTGEGSLYFLTARGKEFYRQLEEQGFVALTGVKDGKSVTLRGKIRPASRDLLEPIFIENPYMESLYPEKTRDALEVFELYEGQGEYFDLTQRPIYRQGFALGEKREASGGYEIGTACTGCGKCLEACPQRCVDLSRVPAVILQEHCLHCGRCVDCCPAGAIIKREEDGHG